jgi:hypothetical protein
MAARDHMPLRVIAFDANGSINSVNSCKTYIDETLLSESHLKPHERLYSVIYSAK